MRELEKLDLLELVLPQNAAGVFSSCSGFRPETRSPRRYVDRQPVFGQSFITVQIVQLDFARWCEPEIAIFDFEKIGCKFRQLARSHQRSRIDQERRKYFGVAMFARMHIKEEICQGTFQPCAPSFIDGESGAGNFCGRGQIQNSCPLSDLPMGSRFEIKLWSD